MISSCSEKTGHPSGVIAALHLPDDIISLETLIFYLYSISLSFSKWELVLDFKQGLYIFIHGN